MADITAYTEYTNLVKTFESLRASYKDAAQAHYDDKCAGVEWPGSQHIVDDLHRRMVAAQKAVMAHPLHADAPDTVHCDERLQMTHAIRATGYVPF